MLLELNVWKCQDKLRGGVYRYAPCGLSKGLVTNYGEGGYKTEGGHEKFCTKPLSTIQCNKTLGQDKLVYTTHRLNALAAPPGIRV